MARNYILRKGHASLTDLVDGTAAYGFPGEYPGRIYFVNNITGSDNNDGLSWGAAMKQIDTALLASETFRVSQATNNKAVRNVIYVQGTETAYEMINQDFNEADLIGIGARALLGGAAGNVHIGEGTSDGMSQAQLVAGWDTTVNNGGGLGDNVFNCHFAVAGSFWAVDVVDWLLGSFEDCRFQNNAASATGGFRASEHFAGSVMRNCHAGGDAGSLTDGFYFTGGVFNQNIIELNSANATRYGFFVDDYLQGGTVVRDNSFYGGTYGLYDNSAETTMLGLALYTGNRCGGGTTGMVVTNKGTFRAIGNWVTSAGTADWFTTIAKS